MISFTQTKEITWDFYKFFSAITLRESLEMHIMSSSSEVKKFDKTPALPCRQTK